MPVSDLTLPVSKRLPNTLRRSFYFAALPTICLLVYWALGETGLIIFALTTPIFFAFYCGFKPHAQQAETGQADGLTAAQEQLETCINDMLFSARSDEQFALFCIEIDDAKDVARRLGSAQLHEIQNRLQLRYANCLRSKDVVFQSGPLHWTIAITPGKNLTLEVAIKHADRFQAVLDDPLFFEDDRFYLTSYTGFTLAQKPFKSAHTLLTQSHSALAEAFLNGPDSVRAFDSTTRRKPPQKASPNLADLNGDIDTNLFAWFQPQISTDTGHISGFEALARWRDNAGNWLSPATILPALANAGQMERLTNSILTQSLTSLKKWDERGLNIDTVGVNFSESDLANPRLFEKIAWDLDRFGIEANRLCIEVLESVIAGEADDMIVRNVTRLSELGCKIDLDDFGTGHSSISTLRRLPVHRLKIDRSFVAKADFDAEQQKMVATILMMAERLDLTCLAEGVETLGEQSILAQLGCRYVQGFGIAKPMPFEQTEDWIVNFQPKHVSTPQIGSKTS